METKNTKSSQPEKSNAKRAATMAEEAETHEVEMRRAKRKAGAAVPSADLPASAARTPPD